MKKIKLNKKLQLNKETIANLNAIKGGDGDNAPTILSICKSCIESNCGGCGEITFEITCIANSMCPGPTCMC